MNNQNKIIKRLIICVMFLNISSILFGAARIGIIENSLISDLSAESSNEDISYESLWFDAVKLNSIELIEMLLVGSKIDINKCDSDGNTALHIASSEGYKDLIILLLKKGADLSVENNNKDKAIDLAKKNWNFEVAEILFAKEYGEIVNYKKEEKDNLVINRYKCDNVGCDYVTAYKYHLTTHKRTHIAKLTFECDICNKAFSEKSNLKKHIRNHTDEKPFRCDVCNKAFSENSNLARHKRTHSDEKPYKCDSDGCNYVTSDKSHLAVHKKKHTGEKPYKCDVNGCKYATSQKSHLFRHKKTHTGVKPYKCDVNSCVYASSYKSNFDVHLRSHLAKELFKMIVDNRKDQVKELLIKGVKIDAKDRSGCTALHLAVKMSRKEILETLIEAGADMTLLDNNKKTAENLAFDLGNLEFVRILQNASKECAARQSSNKE